MDIKAYISSGIIEACLSGIASDEDVRQMESLSEKYPEVKLEIIKVQLLLEKWATANSVPPPPDLKEKIWSKIGQKDNQEQADPLPENSDSTNLKKVDGKEAVSFSRWKYYPAAAAVLLIGISIYFSVTLYQKNIEFQKQLAKLEQQLKANQDSYNSKIALYQQRLSGLVNGNMQGIKLSGTEKHPNMTAIVLWNKKTQEVYLSLKQLPAPPKGMQYQLWSIVDGKPESAGVYESNDTKTALQKMKPVSPNTQMFAVTLEKEGGAESPTLSAMYVAGKI
ncbi:MAG TPA: anti-sigma factor [Edaphocola sp.]|nr:anti-sigma factor [Edaphocola sp.]